MNVVRERERERVKYISQGLELSAITKEVVENIRLTETVSFINKPLL